MDLSWAALSRRKDRLKGEVLTLVKKMSDESELEASITVIR